MKHFDYKKNSEDKILGPPELLTFLVLFAKRVSLIVALIAISLEQAKAQQYQIPEKVYNNNSSRFNDNLNFYYGGGFVGSTGHLGVFKTGDQIKFIPPVTSRGIYDYYVHLAPVGENRWLMPYETWTVPEGFPYETVRFDVRIMKNHVNAGSIVSPYITIDGTPTKNFQGGSWEGATGPNGAFVPGDMIKYIPPEKNSLEYFEVNFSLFGEGDFVPAGKTLRIPEESYYWERKPYQFEVYVENRSGNVTKFMSPPVWFWEQPTNWQETFEGTRTTPVKSERKITSTIQYQGSSVSEEAQGLRNRLKNSR